MQRHLIPWLLFVLAQAVPADESQPPPVHPTKQRRDHWSFEKPLRPAVPPAPEFADRIGNPIDNFIFARLQTEGLTPSPEASRAALIRRVTLDLTGLPPGPQAVDQFISDASPQFYEKLIDLLLDSPAFGERMAWEWLEAARYADSNGYQGDSDRTMWPWRDWVVQAFNRNLPYDQFTIWQIAGDLLSHATPEQKLATGFARNHMINGEGGRIPEENRVEYVMDITETVGTVWLGLTFNCCRCHDHKFDPISRKDYYSMFAFFNQTPVDGGGGNPQAPPNMEWPSEEQKMALAKLNGDAGASGKEAGPLEKNLRNSIPKVMVMEDMAKPRETFMLERGLYDKRGEAVTAATPGRWPSHGSPTNRLGLAQWLVAPENPLTARVTVNRLWQQFFGTGLVKTTGDFGVQGEKPAHPELLDWLAVEFVQNGWDVKRLCRLIVTSATYRQSSKSPPGLAEKDPENRLLARGSRHRRPSWMLRDQALAASGLLVPTVGGAPVKPYQPAGVWEDATFGQRKYEKDKGEKLYRRSIYTFWRRIIGPTMFFDTPSRQVCTVSQPRTNTPLHALATLNDITYVEAARALAERVLTSGAANDPERLDLAFRFVTARKPSAEEGQILLVSVDRLKSQFGQEAGAAAKFLSNGESRRNETLDAAEHAAYAGLCLAILNLDEALTRE